MLLLLLLIVNIITSQNDWSVVRSFPLGLIHFTPKTQQTLSIIFSSEELMRE